MARTRDRPGGPDGPTPQESTESESLCLGARVEDREDEDPDTAVVVNLPDKVASEWDVGDDDTVATYPGNEDYADDAPIAVVAFEEALAEHGLDDYAGDEPLALADLASDSVSFYTFPAPRLRVIERAEEPDEDLLAIADALDEAGMGVDVDGDVVGAKHLGEEYLVDAEGTVREGGALQDRVAELVEEAVDG